MKRFVEGEARDQISLLPECVEDYVGEDNPVRVIDVFVDELDLQGMGFEGTTAGCYWATGLSPSGTVEDLCL